MRPFYMATTDQTLQFISDKIYDMDAMQEKIKDDEASATNMESMVDNDINDPAGNQELNLG